MFQSLHRIIAVLILVSSIFCFSGIARAFTLLTESATAADSCCPADSQSDDSGNPASLLECSCCTASFQTNTFQIGLQPGRLITEGSYVSRLVLMPPSGPLSSIDHPPETV